MSVVVPAAVFDDLVLITTVRAQRAALEHEQRAAALAALATMSRLDAEDQEYDLIDLRNAMRGLRAAYGPGYETLARDAGLPTLAKLDQMCLGRTNDGEGRWRGVNPLDGEAPRPTKGTWVVYRLLDDAGTIVYIGSTGSFPERIRAHQRSKEFATWQASRCDSEQLCRDLETALIDRYRPRLNRMIPTPKVQLQ